MNENTLGRSCAWNGGTHTSLFATSKNGGGGKNHNLWKRWLSAVWVGFALSLFESLFEGAKVSNGRERNMSNVAFWLALSQVVAPFHLCCKPNAPPPSGRGVWFSPGIVCTPLPNHLAGCQELEPSFFHFADGWLVPRWWFLGSTDRAVPAWRV